MNIFGNIVIRVGFFPLRYIPMMVIPRSKAETTSMNFHILSKKVVECHNVSFKIIPPFQPLGIFFPMHRIYGNIQMAVVYICLNRVIFQLITIILQNYNTWICTFIFLKVSVIRYQFKLLLLKNQHIII